MVRKIIISGCNGRMGRVVESICETDPDVSVVAGFDVSLESRAFPVFVSAALDSLLAFALERKVPLVLATTGYSDEQLAQIDEASKRIPIFRSANMSLGINVLLELVKKAAAVLGDSYDIEIVEKHHNQKLDAPSGTALALADSMNEALDDAYTYKYDRSQERKKRDKYEIGISAVRGGNIVGEHEVIFAGQDEVIEFKHTAYSKAVFAKGAVEAAKFLNGKSAGHYDMADVIAAK